MVDLKLIGRKKIPDKLKGKVDEIAIEEGLIKWVNRLIKYVIPSEEKIYISNNARGYVSWR